MNFIIKFCPYSQFLYLKLLTGSFLARLMIDSRLKNVILLKVLHDVGSVIMRVPIKGQVTIQQNIREKLGIIPVDEFGFIEEKGRVYLLKKKRSPKQTPKFRRLRGVANVKMTTDEIMALTGGHE